MCGIVGICRCDGDRVNLEVLRRMRDTLTHRGPDGKGEYVSGPVGLGHRRLSIIDLEGGHQPMTNAAGTISIVYNGELYNYRELRREIERIGYQFRTRSDTEVVLGAYEVWGIDCLQKFNGMFGLGVWDVSQRRLLLARDHMGVKPLYYRAGPDGLLFASEVKALLTHGAVNAAVDPVSLDHYLTYRYVPSPRTLFAGIRKLPPGHLLTYTPGGSCRIRSFSDPPCQLKRISEDAAIGKLRSLLESAVRRQMVSDVPVGAFLSGGLDSSLLVSLMSRETREQVRTFSVGFRGAESGEDELPAAQRVASLFGTNHSTIVLDPTEYWEFLPRSLWHLEEPNGTAATLAQYAVSQLASRNVKVALCGQGADELFGGYNRYLGERLYPFYRRLPSMLKQDLLPAAARLLNRPTGLRGAAALQVQHPAIRFATGYAVFTEDAKHRLYSPMLAGALSNSAKSWKVLSRWLYGRQFENSLAAMLYVDARTWLPDELLMYGDKMCMATSLEMRVPFLDIELVRFVESLPSRMKLRGLRAKHILKRAAEPFLPRSVIYSKKKGFPMPILDWLSGDLHGRVRELILAPDSGCRQFFREEELSVLLEAYRQRKSRDHRQLFLLMCFESWYRMFVIGEGFGH